MENFNIEQYLNKDELIKLELIYDKYNILYINMLSTVNELIVKFDANLDGDVDDAVFINTNSSSLDKFDICEKRVKNNIILLKNNLNDIINSYVSDIEQYLYNRYCININLSYKLAPRTIKMLRIGMIPLIPFSDIIENSIKKIYSYEENKGLSLGDISKDSVIKTIKSHLLLFGKVQLFIDRDEYGYEYGDVFNYRLVFSFQQILANKENLFNNLLKIIEGYSVIDNSFNTDFIYFDEYKEQIKKSEYNQGVNYLFIDTSIKDDYRVKDSFTICFKSMSKKISDMMYLFGYSYDAIKKEYFLDISSFKNEDDIDSITDL